MRVAIYARVSTPRQGREQTIESQLCALREWVSEKGYELSPDDVYVDEGYSGSRLDRPGLDALRDGAEDGTLEMRDETSVTSARWSIFAPTSILQVEYFSIHVLPRETVW